MISCNAGKIFSALHRLFLKIPPAEYAGSVCLAGGGGRERAVNAKFFGRLLGGSAVGAANGVFGGGGGMIAVPLLERIEGRGETQAHATAIALILPASLVSAAVYLWAGLVPWTILLPVSLGVLAGGYLGAKLLPVLPPRALSLLFAALMLAAGIKSLL